MACIHTPCGDIMNPFSISLAPSGSGEIEASLNNCPSATYLWTDSSSLSTYTPDTPNGVYQVVATCTAGDNDTCTAGGSYVCNIALTLGLDPDDRHFLEATASNCTGSFIYSWYLDGVEIVGETSNSLEWAPLGPGTYTFRATCDDDGCYNETSVSISDFCSSSCNYYVTAFAFHLNDVVLTNGELLSTYPHFNFPYSEFDVDMQQFASDFQDWLDEYDDCIDAHVVVQYDEGTKSVEIWFDQLASTLLSHILYADCDICDEAEESIIQQCDCGIPCSSMMIEADYYQDLSIGIFGDAPSGSEDFYVSSFIVDGTQYVSTPISLGVVDLDGTYVRNLVTVLNTLSIPSYTFDYSPAVATPGGACPGGPGAGRPKYFNIRRPRCTSFELLVTVDFGLGIQNWMRVTDYQTESWDQSAPADWGYNFYDVCDLSETYTNELITTDC